MYNTFEKIIKSKGITVYKISKETGISTVTFTNWKNGKYTPKIDKLKSIAEYLEISLDDLYKKNSTYMIYEDLLRKRGLTSYKVSKETGIATSTLSDWKNGRSHPKLDKLELIARYLGVSIDCFNNSQGISIQFSHVSDYEIPLYESIPQEINVNKNITKYIEVSKEFSIPNLYYGIVLSDDAMSPNIMKKDILIVKHTKFVSSGEYAVVKVGKKDLCRKILFDKDGVILIPMNTEYDVIKYTKEQIDTLPIIIYGKVVEIRRRL